MWDEEKKRDVNEKEVINSLWEEDGQTNFGIFCAIQKALLIICCDRGIVTPFCPVCTPLVALCLDDVEFYFQKCNKMGLKVPECFSIQN